MRLKIILVVKIMMEFIKTIKDICNCGLLVLFHVTNYVIKEHVRRKVEKIYEYLRSRVDIIFWILDFVSKIKKWIPKK